MTAFWSKVDKTGECWVWTGANDGVGYGQLIVDGRRKRAHRVAYEMMVGPVPDGLTLDHLCRNPSCVNPAHLEPVTSRENTLRGVSATAVNARKTECRRGHPLSGQNLAIIARRRVCRTCNNIRSAAYQTRKRVAA